MLIQRSLLMEKRIGLVSILILHNDAVQTVNAVLSQYADSIDARLGLPMRHRNISLIAIVVEGDTDTIGALTGKLGKISGVKVKSVLTSYKEDEDGDTSHTTKT